MNSIRTGLAALIIVLIYCALGHTGCAAQDSQRVVDTSPKECTEPEPYGLTMCEGDYYGKMCCAYMATEECLLIQCRNTCGESWESVNIICRKRS